MGPRHIDGPQFFQIGGSRVCEFRGGVHAGVVDQDIESTELSGGSIDGRGNRGGVGAVGLDGKRSAAQAFDLLRDGMGLIGRTVVGDRDISTVGSEAFGDGGADAAAAAGDECNFACECGHAGCSLVGCGTPDGLGTKPLLARRAPIGANGF